jgi:hypothetical protein
VLSKRLSERPDERGEERVRTAIRTVCGAIASETAAHAAATRLAREGELAAPSTARVRASSSSVDERRKAAKEASMRAAAAAAAAVIEPAAVMPAAVGAGAGAMAKGVDHAAVGSAAALLTRAAEIPASAELERLMSEALERAAEELWLRWVAAARASAAEDERLMHEAALTLRREAEAAVSVEELTKREAALKPAGQAPAWSAESERLQAGAHPPPQQALLPTALSPVLPSSAKPQTLGPLSQRLSTLVRNGHADFNELMHTVPRTGETPRFTSSRAGFAAAVVEGGDAHRMGAAEYTLCGEVKHVLDQQATPPTPVLPHSAKPQTLGPLSQRLSMLVHNGRADVLADSLEATPPHATTGAFGWENFLPPINIARPSTRTQNPSTAQLREHTPLPIIGQKNGMSNYGRLF